MMSCGDLESRSAGRSLPARGRRQLASTAPRLHRVRTASTPQQIGDFLAALADICGDVVLVVLKSGISARCGRLFDRVDVSRCTFSIWRIPRLRVVSSTTAIGTVVAVPARCADRQRRSSCDDL